MVYLITYDLRKPVQAYEEAHKAIASLGQAIRPMQSVWFLDTKEPLETVCAKLDPHFDRDDYYYVVSTEDGGGRIKPTHDRWFREHFFRTRLLP